MQFLTPALLKLDHLPTEGEKKASEALIEIIVCYPAEVLQEVRREIESANAILSDKKRRVSGILDLVGVSVDVADTQSMSSRLLKRLWTQSVGLYCQSKHQPIPEFSPISPYWKLLGFQRETPLTDFRGGGVLSLVHLNAFVSRYPAFTLMVMGTESDAKRMPLAIACINLSIMLVKEVGLFNCDAAADVTKLSQLPIWRFASVPDSLDEVRRRSQA